MFATNFILRINIDYNDTYEGFFIEITLFIAALDITF